MFRISLKAWRSSLESSAYAQCSFAYDTPLCLADAKSLLVTLTSFKVRDASRQVAREVWVRRGRDRVSGGLTPVIVIDPAARTHIQAHVLGVYLRCAQLRAPRPTRYRGSLG
jgi:hypothetical protein